MDLTYRTGARPNELVQNECTVRRVVSDGYFGWRLWFAVRCEGGGLFVLSVLVDPGGTFDEHGQGGRTWGFAQVAPGTWQVSPSIHFPGTWHETPRVVGVPSGEPWEPQ
jgi:hypothetical protein